MSTFGWSNVTGIDASSGGSSVPGGVSGSIQYNDNGVDFGGVANFTYDVVTQTMNVNKVKPTIIIDSFNTTGSTGQVLKTTGSTLYWDTDQLAQPALPFNSVQYNKLGAFAGDSNFVYDDTPGVNKLTTNVFEAVGEVIPSANGAGQVGNATKRWGNMEAVGATIDTVVSLTVRPSLGLTGSVGTVFQRYLNGWFGALDVSSHINGNSAYFNTWVEPVDIRDTLGNLGTVGQVLTKAAGGIQWQTQPTSSICFTALRTGTASTLPGGLGQNVTFTNISINSNFTAAATPTAFIQCTVSGTYVFSYSNTVRGTSGTDSVVSCWVTESAIQATVSMTTTAPNNHYQVISNTYPVTCTAGQFVTLWEQNAPGAGTASGGNATLICYKLA